MISRDIVSLVMNSDGVQPRSQVALSAEEAPSAKQGQHLPPTTSQPRPMIDGQEDLCLKGNQIQNSLPGIETILSAWLFSSDLCYFPTPLSPELTLPNNNFARILTSGSASAQEKIQPQRPLFKKVTVSMDQQRTPERYCFDLNGIPLKFIR